MLEGLKVITLTFSFLIILFVYTGVIYKFALMVISASAFPTILGLYYAEYFLEPLFGKLVTLNVPQKGLKKVFFHGVSTFITIVAFGIFRNIYEMMLELNSYQILEKVINGDVISLPIAIFIILCLIVIYTISFFSERDHDEPTDKIQKASYSACYHWHFKLLFISR